MPVQRDPDWQEGVAVPPAQGGNLGRELLDRTNAEHYVLPIKTTFAVRMLTPVRNVRGRCQIPIVPP
jgi:hypothetical protein